MASGSHTGQQSSCIIAEIWLADASEDPRWYPIQQHIGKSGTTKRTPELNSGKSFSFLLKSDKTMVGKEGKAWAQLGLSPRLLHRSV